MSKAKLWFAVIAGSLVLYLSIFWDHIPTLVAHKYYCENEAGFSIYKTLPQWKSENPQVFETLSVPRQDGPDFLYQEYNDGHGKKTTYFLNERFTWVRSQQDELRLLPIIRSEQEIWDVKKNELLAKYVDFASGNSVKNTVGPPGPLKFWLVDSNCNDGALNKSGLLAFADSVANRRPQGIAK